MKKMIYGFSLVLFVSALLSGCAATGGVRAGGERGGIGTDARFAGYPESSYLRAVGSGQSEPEARNRAVSELTRIFVSKVKSEAIDTVKSVMVDRKGESLEETLYSRIQVVSDLELEGVEIPEVRKDGATYYALAVLERQRAARGWKNRIEDIDSRINGELVAARERKSSLLRYRALKNVTSLWAERAVYMSRLNILGFGAPSAYEGDVRNAMSALGSLKGSMRFYLEISGNRTLVDGVAKALGEAGFVITPVRSGADVVIRGSVDVRKLEMDTRDWEYARATASVSVEDAMTGESVGEVSENIRSAHVSFSEASSKAVRKLTPMIADSLIRALEE